MNAKAKEAEVLEPEGTEVATVEETAPLVVSESMAMIGMIERAATDPNVDVDKMERLMAMHKDLKASQAEQSFNEAMNAAQGEMRPVGADLANKQTSSRYASYQALDKALRPIYNGHGFSLSFNSGEGAAEDSVRVLCYVAHKDGHTRTYQADVPADGKGPQGGAVMTKTHAVGSAFTYGQRYLLKLIFSVVVGEDDDGNAATMHETLSLDQETAIIALLEETGIDTDKFLVWAKAETVGDILASNYDKVHQELKSKKKAMAEK